jgi:hypothetical protein
MKKIYTLLLIIMLTIPLAGRANIEIGKTINPTIEENLDSATLTWENPQDFSFSKTVIFRSSILIEDYFTYEAVEGLCDKVYEGNDETYTDIGLAQNLSYYYVFFSVDKYDGNSKAIVLKKNPVTRTENDNESEIKPQENTRSLVGAPSETVNRVALNEAGIVYNYNKAINSERNKESKRLTLFIIVKSPHDLSENDRNAISYFIDQGTPTTILLGNGERAGVLNSYLSVFDKLPRNTLEWQDVIKIANGRWPDERNLDHEEEASDVFFNAIYRRDPDINNPKDSSAITIIAYGLRPAQRNMESEKNAIHIYRSIFNRNPTEASDWDLVRAIAYSGATR